jgi:hypothetical protein
MLNCSANLVTQKAEVRSAAWVILMMIVGFWTAALITPAALPVGGGDPWRFWLGQRGMVASRVTRSH